jgi:hypothetical protein
MTVELDVDHGAHHLGDAPGLNVALGLGALFG